MPNLHDEMSQYLYTASGIPLNDLAIPRCAAEIAIDSTADKVCTRLFQDIVDFEATLSANLEVGMLLVVFGFSCTIAVTSISSVGPNLIRFVGYENGQEVRLIQHVNQLSFLLRPLPKEFGRPRRKIGFQTWAETKEHPDNA